MAEMKRRSFIAHVASAAALGVAVPIAKPAIAQGIRKLRMVTTWPKNFPGLGTSAERLARRIGEISNGTIRIKVYAAGELVPAFESFDAVTSGAADMYHASEYYWQGKSKAFNFFAAVPFGLTGSEHAAWIQAGGGQQLWDDLYDGFNLKPFLAGNTGVQMGGWAKKPLRYLDDFSGLKFRMPGLGGEVLQRIGATAVNIPGGEIYPALQLGTIDATEWVGPWNDLALGFHKVAKFYHYPGIHEPGTTVAAVIRKNVWNTLTSDQQATIQAATRAENNDMYADFNANNGRALATLVNRHRVQLVKYSDEILGALGDAAKQVLVEIGSTDPMTKKVFDSFMRFRRDIITWTSVSNEAFAETRRKHGIL